MSNILVRPRRNRKSPWIRDLISENHLKPSDLIQPFFVICGTNKREEIKTLADNYRFSIDLLIREVKKAQGLGIKAIMLFPCVEQILKSDDGKEACNEDNLICRAIKEIKKLVPEIGIIVDVALDPYTTHGHDGIVDKNGYVLNDKTVEILCQQALVQARAGCDMVAPSDMMDRRVGAIRQFLDKNGYENIGIMSYAAKYASNFYGPFRDAVGSDKNLQKSDKKTYQMDFRNSLEALREIKLDENEGADMLIIKPGIVYLDIVAKAKEISNLPIVSYQVSGEYAMLKLAAQNGLLNFNEAMFESLIAFKRAGASAIITYCAMEIATLL
jgi:porphobilinogen synthase